MLSFGLSRIINIMNSIYPVGSTYISTTNTCPMASIITGSTWTQIATNVVVSVNTSVPIKGDGNGLVLTNGSVTGTLSSGAASGQVSFLASNIGAVGGTRGSLLSPGEKLMGVTDDASKSGIVGTVTRTNLTLYIFKRTA